MRAVAFTEVSYEADRFTSVSVQRRGCDPATVMPSNPLESSCISHHATDKDERFRCQRHEAAKIVTQRRVVRSVPNETCTFNWRLRIFRKPPLLTENPKTSQLEEQRSVGFLLSDRPGSSASPFLPDPSPPFPASLSRRSFILPFSGRLVDPGPRGPPLGETLVSRPRRGRVGRAEGEAAYPRFAGINPYKLTKNRGYQLARSRGNPLERGLP